MEKPNVRGASPSRKAHLALREKLNRKSKPPPPFPVKPGDVSGLVRPRAEIEDNKQRTTASGRL
jgi:hypothetical protein